MTTRLRYDEAIGDVLPPLELKTMSSMNLMRDKESNIKHAKLVVYIHEISIDDR